MFRCYSYTIIREHINSCLLKLKLLKKSTNPLNGELNPICYLLALLGAHHILHVSGLRFKIHRCVLNTMVVWLHILGPSWCMCAEQCNTPAPIRT